MFVAAAAVLVKDELEQKQVEHDDEGGDRQPEYHRQTAQPVTGSKYKKDKIKYTWNWEIPSRFEKNFR